jgi:NLI interacting factor-like phosphatase
VGQPYVIVWDLDGTLGEFAELERHPGSQRPVRLQVRPGIEEALRRLSAAGFVHTVLTVAMKRYADIVLHGTGLAGYFARVEGRGERPKGDATGIAAAFGIPEKERPHRMLFVGDRLMFDQPADPHIVFHLELFALTRAAEDFARLVEHLRGLGGGSLRRGFDHLGCGRSGWRRLWPWSAALPPGKPVCRRIDPLAPLLLLARPDECPVIGFEKPPQPEAEPCERVIVPADVEARLP